MTIEFLLEKALYRSFSKKIIATVKYRRVLVMMWGCFSYHGVGRLVFIDGIINFIANTDILANNLRSLAEQMGIETFIFQQDNNRKYTLILAENYFTKKNRVDFLSTTISRFKPNRKLWTIIKQKLSKLIIKTKEE